MLRVIYTPATIKGNYCNVSVTTMVSKRSAVLLRMYIISFIKALQVVGNVKMRVELHPNFVSLCRFESGYLNRYGLTPSRGKRFSLHKNVHTGSKSHSLSCGEAAGA